MKQVNEFYQFIVIVVLLINFVNCDTDCLINVLNLSGVEGVSKITPNGVQYCSYLGVPYAQPPINDLRFEAPQKLNNWQSKKYFTEIGNECLQVSEYYYYSKEPKTLKGDEDCLYLNIHTTQITSTEISNNNHLRPVFFWIHGGSFNCGSATSDVNGVDYIVEKDVIVVTINYRLSVLGFLSIPEANISGNFGLKDQQMALKWVQENIIYFGGDPNRVTLVGWSAGSASVTYHMYSESSSGLFHNVIAMSGTMLSPWAYAKNPKKCSNRLYRNIRSKGLVNNRNNLIEYKKLLKLLNPKDLLHLNSNVYFSETHYCFLPTIETNYFDKNNNQFINKIPTELIKIKPPVNDVPLLIGLTKREVEQNFYFNGVMIYNIDESFFNNKNKTIHNLIKNFIKKCHSNGYNLNKLMSTADMIYPTLNFIQAYAKTASSNIFKYQFSFQGLFGHFKDLNIDIYGATHGDDLGYLFNPFCIHSNCSDGKLIKNETIIRENVLRMWTDFIKFNNPTPNNSETTINWPNYKENNEYLDIDLEPTILQDENDDYFYIWNKIEKCLQEYECDFLFDNINNAETEYL